jgi:TatD DNase family protein
MPQLADSHVHLDDARFDADRDAVLRRAHAAGVVLQVVPGVGIASWTRIEALCTPGSGLFPAWGLHPMFMHVHRDEDLATLPHWLETKRPVAVGEIGLDFHQEDHDAERQRVYFRRQLTLARDFDLPVILHARAAMDEVTATLRHMGGLRGVVHSFSGSEQQAKQLWQMGFHIGIGGPVTYDRAQRLRRIVARCRLSFCCWKATHPINRMPRTAANATTLLRPDVLQCIAALRDEPQADVAATTTDNTRRLFGLDRSHR